MPDLFRIAIVVNPDLPSGFLANTVGAIAIGLGARFPFLAGTRLSDHASRTIDVSANRPVPILAAEADALRALAIKATGHISEEMAVVVFPSFARSLNAFPDYERIFPQKDLCVEAIDGLGLAGPGKLVRSLTGSLRLLR